MGSKVSRRATNVAWISVVFMMRRVLLGDKALEQERFGDKADDVNWW